MCSKCTSIHTAFTGIHTHQTFPRMALSALQQGQLHKENIFGDLRLHQSGETSQCHNTSHDRTSAMLNGRERERRRKKRGGEMTVDSSALPHVPLCCYLHAWVWNCCLGQALILMTCELPEPGQYFVSQVTPTQGQMRRGTHSYVIANSQDSILSVHKYLLTHGGV